MTTLILKIDHDLEKIPNTVRPLVEKQLPFALSVALNRTVNDSIGNVKGAMTRAFGTPRPYTLNSMYMRRATKSRLLAGLFFKDSFGGNTPASKYIARHIAGDTRAHKPNENIMTKLRSKDVGFGVTGGAYKGGSLALDSSGNIPRGMYTRALNALRKKDEAKAEAEKFSIMKFVKEKFFGYGPKKKRRSRNDFFVIEPDTKSGLKAGVWYRKGKQLSQVLSLQERRPNYKKILDFHGETYGKAQALFDKHLSFALAQVLQNKLSESSYTNENKNS